MPGGTLFPDTMKQYDDYTIREALHNCIAHQDYTLQQRINFVENPGYLYYSNAGTFIPGTLENVLRDEEPQTHFRNECLCRAMVDFNMIDTVSRGIKKMFNEQWRRHFPMPDYEIDQIKKIASKQQPMSKFRCIRLRNIKQLPVDEDGLINYGSCPHVRIIYFL